MKLALLEIKIEFLNIGTVCTYITVKLNGQLN